MSAFREVLVHRCRPETDRGLPFRCHCLWRTTDAEARALVESGKACWKKQLSGGVGLKEIHKEIILLFERHHPLHAVTIGERQIVDAYVHGSARAIERIDVIGESERKRGDEWTP